MKMEETMNISVLFSILLAFTLSTGVQADDDFHSDLPLKLKALHRKDS